MLPDIPPELYGLFVDQTALEKDTKLRIDTLKACSLASRALSHQTRQYLLYKIKFQPKTNVEDATNKMQHFRQLLESNPRSNVISYLCVLEIRLGPYCLWWEDAIHGLPTVLNILCADERGPLRLHTLKMNMGCRRWRELPEDLRASLYWAVSCRHLEGITTPASGLKKLEFIALTDISVSFFARCTQTVKELGFIACSFDSPRIMPPLSSDVHLACNPHLRLEAYGYFQEFSECLRAILNSPAAAILARIKHLAVGCSAFLNDSDTRALPSILSMTRHHLKTLELQGILGTIASPINLTSHHQLRRFVFKTPNSTHVHSFKAFEPETNDPTSIKDIEIHIQRIVEHSFRQDLGIGAGSGLNWKNLDVVLSGPRYPLLRRVDISVFFEGSSTYRSPVSVPTLIVRELRALLPNLSLSERIQLGIVVKQENMPR